MHHPAAVEAALSPEKEGSVPTRLADRALMLQWHRYNFEARSLRWIECMYVLRFLSSRRHPAYICTYPVCILQFKLFFLPLDIQHTQYPCGFFLLERHKLCGHTTMPQRCYVVMQ